MMSVQAINGGMMSLNAQQISEDTNKLTGSESFTYALDAAKQLIETTQAADKDVQQKTVDFMTGENDNVVLFSSVTKNGKDEIQNIKGVLLEIN